MLAYLSQHLFAFPLDTVGCNSLGVENGLARTQRDMQRDRGQHRNRGQENRGTGGQGDSGQEGGACACARARVCVRVCARLCARALSCARVRVGACVRAAHVCVTPMDEAHAPTHQPVHAKRALTRAPPPTPTGGTWCVHRHRNLKSKLSKDL